MYPAIAGLPADGNDVGFAVAVEVRDGQVFTRDAAVIDDLPLPFLAFAVRVFVNPHAPAFSPFFAQVITHADDDFILAIAIKVGTPERVPPAEFVVDDVMRPVLFSKLACMNGDAVAVPRLYRSDEKNLLVNVTGLDFTCPAISSRV